MILASIAEMLTEIREKKPLQMIGENSQLFYILT